jgi:hypothetical protein
MDTDAASGSRSKLYLNGSEVTVWDSATEPGSGISTNYNSTKLHTIGRNHDHTDATTFSNSYMSEFILVDGQQLTPGDFGEFNSDNVWVPKAYAGTYGTNGFYLDFANSAVLGNDVSGNNNDFTSSGLTTADQFTDTPTNVYATLNPLDYLGTASAHTLSDGNLRIVKAGTAAPYHATTIRYPMSGKWVFEATMNSAIGGGGAAGINFYIGLNLSSGSGALQAMQVYAAPATGEWYKNGSGVNQGTWAGLGNGDVIRFEFDVTNSTCTVYKNNSAVITGTGINFTSYPDATSIAVTGNTSATTFDLTFNFGATSFAHTPTSGYQALCTANMAAPAIADGRDYFEPVLYAGTGASNTVTSTAFTPDLVAIKNRTDGSTHWSWFDSIRGTTKYIRSSATDAEATDANSLTAFNATGFTLGTGGGTANVNTSAKNYVAYCFKEGATPGFDIVSYTGTGAAHAENHNLGTTPKFMIVKNLTDAATQWRVYHAGANASPATGIMYLSDTVAFTTDANVWNNTAPTSTQFTVGTSTGVNANTKSYIAYLFADVTGFSKFGSYTGNGNADGAFVWCGFKPALIVIKPATVGAENWLMYNTSASTYNANNLTNYWDAQFAEASVSGVIDILSNGFKLRDNSSARNQASATYTYMAWAENPFGGSTVAPAKAR